MENLTIKKWEAIPARSSVAEAWSPDGFDCKLWVDPPGQEWLNFRHDVDERVVVLEGHLEFEISGARSDLYPGDEVHIPAGASHSVWNRGNTTARWLYGYKNG